MKRLIFTCCILLSFLFRGFAQVNTDKAKTLDNIFANKREVYFKFKVADKSEVYILTNIISIDNFKGNEVYAYANRKEFSIFLDQKYDYTILANPGSLLNDSDLNMGKMQKDDRGRTIWNFYPTYQQYLDLMDGFVSSNPAICKLDTIGTSVQGRLLLAVKISDSVNVDRGKPQVFYTSSMHGDETTGYILMLHLIDSLLSGYGHNTRITNLVNNCQIFINPLANPDGTYAGGNNTVNGSTRENANNVNLNRNYPDPQAGQHPDGNPWQPETQAFMNYQGQTHFVESLNFHGGAEVFNYPWDTWYWYYKLHPDDSWWQVVAHEYADSCQYYGPAGYFTDVDSNGITNGSYWYQITGGRQDYTTYFRHGREATLEISEIKTLPADSLLNYWKYNVRSFLDYFEEAWNGINGQVTDSVTRHPLKAKVEIPDHDTDSSFVYSALPSGWYFRPIYQGTYNLTFTSPGYFPKTINGVNVTNHTTKRINVKLIPLHIGGVDNQIIWDYTLVHPNPSQGNAVLSIPGDLPAGVKVELFNTIGKSVYSNAFTNLNSHSVQLDLQSLSKGLYFIRLHADKIIYESKVVIN
ncbi:MAG: M14 family zinc carboxypeptidase [Bacteroidetes bacterium]|nr:M14 family zinc carboxypeptidase [Bacteroidota bacterium]